VVGGWWFFTKIAQQYQQQYKLMHNQMCNVLFFLFGIYFPQTSPTTVHLHEGFY